MCLAVPARIIELNGEQAVVEISGVRKDVSVVLIDAPAIGEYVLVHVGFALSKIDEAEAAATLAMFAEMREAT